MTNISATGLGGDQRDLATINNFWGSVGIAPETVRPVDLFAVNSLELPPFAGCGASLTGGAAPYGCGRLSVNGAHVGANFTRWAAYEAGRKATVAIAGGGTVELVSATRMAFEANAVLWTLNISNPSSSPTAVFDLELDVGMPVAQSVVSPSPSYAPSLKLHPPVYEHCVLDARAGVASATPHCASRVVPA